LPQAQQKHSSPRTVFNFSGGPGALPEIVLAEAQAAVANVPQVGLPLLGIGHRTAWFRDVVDETEVNIRALLDLPTDYRVLFLQGGGNLQFTMIPISFLRGQHNAADYLSTGYWSRKAVPEAEREGSVRVVWDGIASNFTRLPADDELEFNPKAPYLHYVSNETVEGIQFARVLGLDSVPRVCDMSSDFLCRPFDATKFSLIYAHAQKNLGPAGVTIVIVKDDLLRRIPGNLPAMLDYRVHAEHGSVYNTPPVFAIYVTMLVTRWLRNDIGGLSPMGAINRAKASRLYSLLDASSGFYVGRARADRSWMNVVFNLSRPELEPLFLKEAQAAGFMGLEGHRSLGGLRASLYNAVTLTAVEELCSFMKHFEECHGV
jgi:phosphoserine aminotransferase